MTSSFLKKHWLISAIAEGLSRERQRVALSLFWIRYCAGCSPPVARFILCLSGSPARLRIPGSLPRVATVAPAVEASEAVRSKTSLAFRRVPGRADPWQSAPVPRVAAFEVCRIRQRTGPPVYARYAVLDLVWTDGRSALVSEGFAVTSAHPNPSPREPHRHGRLRPLLFGPSVMLLMRIQARPVAAISIVIQELLGCSLALWEIHYQMTVGQFTIGGRFFVSCVLL
jgi:hypothetical protein